MEHQIPKLRLPLLVNADDFAIEHGQFCIRYRSSDVATRSANEANGCPLCETN
jgi:hypothetical protein